MEQKSNKEKSKCIKRNSAIHKANRIKNELFSLAQNEINEKKKIVNELFSFSSFAVNDGNKKKIENNIDLKKNNVEDKKISNDSSCDNSDLENSSDISCDDEKI